MTAAELERFNRNAPAGTPPADLQIDPRFGLPRWYVEGAVGQTLSPLDFIGAPVKPLASGVAREAMVAARLRALNLERAKTGGLTNHGILRSGQRGISDKDVDEAVASAIREGSVASKRGGYYNQRQTHYRGSNGVTVIIADEGRKKGQIITLFREKLKGRP